MQEVKKLVSDTSFIFSDYIVVSLFSFFYWVIVGKLLLPEQYGVVATAVNIIIFLSTFCMFGLNYSVWKLIPEYLERKQKNKIGPLLRFSLKTVILLVLLIGAFLLIFSPTITSSFKFSFEVLVICIASIVVYSISGLFGNVLLGFQNPKRLFITDAIGNFLKVSVSSVLIFLNFAHFGPLIGFLSCFLIITLLRIPNIPISGDAEIDKKLIIFKYAMPALVSTVAWSTLVNGQYLILTLIKDPTITGFFAIAMLLTSQIFVIPNTITQALFPITSRLSVLKNKQKRQNHMINLVFRYVLFISLPLLIFMTLFSRPIVLIFSSELYLSAADLFPILAVAALIYACGNVFLTSLYASGKPLVNRNIIIVATLIFLLVSIPLTYLFSSFGLAVAYFISVSVLAFLSYIFIRRYLRLELPKRTIMKLLIAITISFSFFYIAALSTTGLLIGLVWAGIATAVYLLVLLFLDFYIKEDMAIAKMFVERVPIFKKQIQMILNFLSKYAQNTIS